MTIGAFILHVIFIQHQTRDLVVKGLRGPVLVTGSTAGVQTCEFTRLNVAGNTGQLFMKPLQGKSAAVPVIERALDTLAVAKCALIIRIMTAITIRMIPGKPAVSPGCFIRFMAAHTAFVAVAVAT